MGEVICTLYLHFSTTYDQYLLKDATVDTAPINSVMLHTFKVAIVIFEFVLALV